MASMTLGRVACPIGCGHNAAQVKIKTDKASGTAHPYVHCAGCGLQLHTRNEEQAGHLRKMMRPEKGAEAPPAGQEAAPGVERPPVDVSVPPAQKKASGALLAGFLLGGAA